jgi:hypothetical protein
MVTKVERNSHYTLEGEVGLAGGHLGSGARELGKTERANLNNNYARSGDNFGEEMRDKGKRKEGRKEGVRYAEKCGRGRR